MRTLKSTLACLVFLLSMFGYSMGAVDSRKFDEVSRFNWEDLMARLDGLNIELQNDPVSYAHIIVYDGRMSRRGEVQGWMKCVRSYLVERRGMDTNRVTIVDGGFREFETIEMWIVPPDSVAPNASPTVMPKDVKYKRGVLKKNRWRSLCNI